ncbi:HU family DNA-binding protein [candidate division KSB1 bacterium]
MRTVTKKEVTRRTAESLNEKISTTEAVVDTVFNTMREIMMNADSEVRIEIRDFGVFEVKKTNPKPNARNPRTGEVIYVPARRKTHFKPGKILKTILKKPIK